MLHAVCGRYTNTLAPAQLQERFGVAFPADAGSHRFNVAPTERVLAVVRGERGLHARVLRWGLVPWWAKDLKGAARMINARIETVERKPAFRELLAGARGREGGRTLICADGWFEWLKAEDPRQPRQPFHFSVDGGAPFAFAGLWARARIDGQTVETSTILTRSALDNPVASRIHDRMPVVVGDRDGETAWLGEDIDATEALAALGSLAPERLRVTAANPRVNRSGLEQEGPDLLVAPVAA